MMDTGMTGDELDGEKVKALRDMLSEIPVEIVEDCFKNMVDRKDGVGKRDKFKPLR